MRCYIGLGSNLETPIEQVKRALTELQHIPKCTFIASSSLYRSAPVGPQDQPDFINAVAAIDTALSAEHLLDELQALEHSHRRVRERHWGPRTLDLDILLFGNDVINNTRLTVPHTYMYERNFVLWPLAEIAPNLVFPDTQTMDDKLSECPMGSLEKLAV